MDDDAELARAFVAREAWAYEAAYRMHGKVLYAAALGVLRDAQDAQDCVHDVLVRLWQRGNDFMRERGSLRAFLAVCVRNEALSRLRVARNRERIAASIPEPSDEPDVGEQVVQRVAIRGALETLDPKQRTIIELAYYTHLTHEQIAAKLKEPVGTVKSRLSAALRKLRERFTEESSHVGA